MKCTEIRDELETRDIDEVWSEHLKWVQTLIPFWKQAIITIAEKTDFDTVKRDKHLKAAENAIYFIDDWRYERVKLIKARYNEIESAISFIRNNALNNKVSKFLFAPICRNVAGVLRHTLHNHTQRNDKHLPTLVSQHIFAFAEIYLCFPFDENDFVFYMPASIHTENRDDLNNYNLMLENAGKRLGITDFIDEINKKAEWIWQNFKSAQDWQIPDEIWHTEIDNISKKLYYQNMKQFYDK